MSENNVNTNTTPEESAGRDIKQAYMNRLFCSTKERVSFILYTAFGTLGLGKFDIDSDIWLYKIYGIQPVPYAKAKIALTAWDMINDPITAAIIDNMRTRWGKFKPFQYLSLFPNILLGIFACFLPVIAGGLGLASAQRLTMFMVYKWLSETVGAFFGGGGYIDNVFTPNPNERTSLLVSSQFVNGLLSKFPAQVMGLLYDLVGNGVISANLTKVFVATKSVVWVIAMIPTIMWYINSKERVAQSEKPPHPIKGILSVFKNRPLLIYTLSGLIDGINIGSGEDLYYNDVLNFNLLPTIAGIPGSPISYASYAIAPKLRQKFSTKTLWFFSRGSVVFSEGLFFLVGCIGGKDHGLYLKKIPMTITFAIGDMTEMFFYATKKVIGKEINYEVLDYCEWQNGFRVEATINLITGYFTKVKDAILNVVNANLLQKWAKYEIGENVVQTAETKWRLFIIAFGPHLIFDVISLLPMLLYNIDKSTRDRMYRDLERTRAARAESELLRFAEEKISNEEA